MILYGDSLSGQSDAYFNWFISADHQATVVDDAVAGSAPCYALPQMLSDASAGVMSVAVIQFSGNAFGCMSYPPGSDAYYQAYQQQVTQAVQAFAAAGIHSFIIGAPMTYGQVENSDVGWDHLNEIYATIAATNPDVTFVNAGTSVEDNQQFAWTLPCLSFESYCGPGRENIVRAADGAHFCPQDPNAGVSCAAWNSGAIRYAMAMAQAVDGYLGSGSAPPFEGPPLPPPGSAPTLAPGQAYPYQNLHDALTVVAPLLSGQSLQSIDGRYSAVLQSDGNFVIYGPTGAVWSTNTAGTEADRLVLQTDGNVVLYRGAAAVWSTVTAGTPGDNFALQENGTLVLYGPTGALWGTPEPEESTSDAVGLAATPSGGGYWLVSSEGRVIAYGDAVNSGSLAGTALNRPVVGAARTPDGAGYWLVASDGGIFSFGYAGYYGSTGNIALNQPIVGMAPTPDGGGYWLVAADGGVFCFGDAGFYGSTGSLVLNAPVVGMMATPTGHGYDLVASDGGVFTFGDGRFAGSMGGRPLNAPITSMAMNATTGGYWLIAEDGGVFAFDTPFFGSGTSDQDDRIVAAATTTAGSGYWLAASDGEVMPFGQAHAFTAPS